MIDVRKSGHIVTVDDGRIGRTYHNKGLINGKVPVFLATKTESAHGVEFPVEFAETGTLFEPEKVKAIGFID